jgi:hypothetical protein
MKNMELDSKYSYIIVVLPHPSPFLNPTIDLKEHDQDHYQFVFTFLDNSESEVAYHISRTTQSLFSMMC